jgi:hypothetical protein
MTDETHSILGNREKYSVSRISARKIDHFRTNSLLMETGNLLRELKRKQGSEFGQTGNLLEPRARTVDSYRVLRLAPDGDWLRFAK